MFLALLPSKESAKELFNEIKPLRNWLSETFSSSGYKETNPLNYGFAVRGGDFTESQLRVANDYQLKNRTLLVDSQFQLYVHDFADTVFVGLQVKQTDELREVLQKLGRPDDIDDVYITIGELGATKSKISPRAAIGDRWQHKVKITTAHYETFGVKGAYTGNPPIMDRVNELPSFQ